MPRVVAPRGRTWAPVCLSGPNCALLPSSRRRLLGGWVCSVSLGPVRPVLAPGWVGRRSLSPVFGLPPGACPLSPLSLEGHREAQGPRRRPKAGRPGGRDRPDQDREAGRGPDQPAPRRAPRRPGQGRPGRPAEEGGKASRLNPTTRPLLALAFPPRPPFLVFFPRPLILAISGVQVCSVNPDDVPCRDD